MIYVILCPRCSQSLDIVCEHTASYQTARLLEVRCPIDGCDALFRPQLADPVVAVRPTVPRPAALRPSGQRFSQAS